MKPFSRFFGTDDEKVLLDRRLFLLGATVTASGLILPRSVISIPKPESVWVWRTPPTRYYFLGDDFCEGAYPNMGPNTVSLPFKDFPKMPLYVPGGEKVFIIHGKTSPM